MPAASRFFPRTFKVRHLVGGTVLSASLLMNPLVLYSQDEASQEATQVESQPEEPSSATNAQSDSSAASTTEESEDLYDLMKIFVDTYQEIDRNYVKEIDRRKLVEAGVRGMLEELDPYSDYIAPDDLNQFNEAITQEFGGVGIRVEWDAKTQSISVISAMAGGPAFKSGIRAGDRVTEINGQIVKDFPTGRELNHAVQILRGKVGEKVELTVTHTVPAAALAANATENVEGAESTSGVESPAVDKPDTSDENTPVASTPESTSTEPAPVQTATAATLTKEEKITLTRETIQLETVLGNVPNEDGTWKLMLDPEQKIGYFRISHFTGRTTDEVREALKTLKKEDMQGLIIDLRYNPGGLLDAAVQISDMFIEEGLIVSTDGRNSVHKSWSAKRAGTFTGFPIAILVNRFSASASEIVSACLQDHDRAIVIGERTWGKGSVQDVINMEGGKSALKLTTASYHRPSGKNIHRFPKATENDEWGVIPNDGYKVDFTLTEHRAYQENRAQRDVLSREVKTNFEDRQLSKAVEYLKTTLNPAPEESEQPTEESTEKKDDASASDSKKEARGPFFMVPKLRVG